MTHLALPRIGGVPRFDRLCADARRWGWIRSLCARIMSMVKRYAGLHIYRVGVRQLVGQGPKIALPRGTRLRVARCEELLKAALDPALDMSPDFVRRALARGDIAFGAFEGHRLIAYSWRTFTAAPHFDGLWATVDRPYFLGYKAYTRPSHRGRRIHVAVALFSDSYLLERGYTAEVGFVDIINYSSLAVASFLGRQKIGYVGHLRWFGKCIPFRTPAVRRIGARLFQPAPTASCDLASRSFV
jgi:hypothetical protein